MRELKVGDIVKLKRGIYVESPTNPSWGGTFGKTKGKIVAIHSASNIRVDWENGFNNSYHSRDLNLVEYNPGELLDEEALKIKNCAHCGNHFNRTMKKIKTHDGTIICNNCFKEFYFVCTECGNIYEISKRKLHGEDYFCKSCFDALFFECCGCHHFYFLSEKVTNCEGESFCGGCYDDLYSHCNGCGEEYLRENLSSGCDDESYCEECWDERFRTCADCGNVFWTEDVVFNEEDDEYYCAECNGSSPVTPSRRTVETQRQVIQGYNFRPEPVLKKMPWENILYMGIELEVEHEENARFHELAGQLEEFLDTEKIKDRFYFKFDSSVHGFEIVTHPFTLAYAHKELKLFKILQWLRENKFTSFESGACGLHIHINKEFFEEIDITKLRIFFAKNKSILERFSNRQGRNTNYCNFEPWDLKRFTEGIYPDGRYWALNFNSSYNTIEFRLFRGTLDYERFLANLQFVEAMARFVKTIGITSLIVGEGKYTNNSWSLFFDWAKTEKKYAKMLNLFRKEQLCA